MGTLQFIDSMTGRLAWPLAAVALGIIFRRSVTQLLGRVRRLKWREGEAELADLAGATEDVQQAIEEVGKPLPEEEGERTATYRARIERLVQEAVTWGRRLGDSSWDEVARSLTIEWNGDQPRLRMMTSEYERHLHRELGRYEYMARHGTNQDEARQARRDANSVLAQLNTLRQADVVLDRANFDD